MTITTAAAGATEFRFDADGSLIELGADTTETEIDLRTTADEPLVEHLVELASGGEITVVGANAYQPEGPMTTFFATGSSRGTIDSWSTRVASYRTNDIVSIQRREVPADATPARRPNLVAV
ncbi:MAG: hypothetical protein R2733_09535 [Acidimicrobiales bacterium]